MIDDLPTWAELRERERARRQVLTPTPARHDAAYFEARRAWLESGGSAADFERAWADLRANPPK